MSSYARPTAQSIQRWTRVNRYLTGQSSGDFSTLIDDLTPNSEAETAQNVGTALFGSATLTADQVLLLQRAVANRLAADILEGLDTEKVSGTMQPLLIDEEKLPGVMSRYRERAEALESLAASGEGVGVTNITTGFGADTVSVFTKTGDLW